MIQVVIGVVVKQRQEDRLLNRRSVRYKFMCLIIDHAAIVRLIFLR